MCGDEKIIYTLCGAGVGLPTQGLVEWGAPHTQSPRKVFPVGIAWGGFEWMSETQGCIESGPVSCLYKKA